MAGARNFKFSKINVDHDASEKNMQNYVKKGWKEVMWPTFRVLGLPEYHE